MQVDRNNYSTDSKLIIYSGNKIYETSLPINPVTTFHPEWGTRDPKYPLKIRISIKKENWVLINADGSAVNTMSSLGVYHASGDLIPEESYGIHLSETKKKTSRRKARAEHLFFSQKKH